MSLLSYQLSTVRACCLLLISHHCNFSSFLITNTVMKIDSHNPSIVNISPQEFRQLSQQPLLIDVRSALEYKTGHAPNALNLSLPRILVGILPIFRNLLLPQWFRELPKDQPIAVICLSAHRSPIAARQLVKMGFSHIYNITGGMIQWRHLNLEISLN